ncbi:MAG: UvrD-helicase domain-containing protein [Bryobacteraceae bacterium]
MKLSDEQQSAVRRTGQDVCVVAGPGSGKTRVLVERFCWLVEEGISPLRILAITFTEKAANEIKKRLVQRFADQPERRKQIERAYVSTVHAFCMRLLRENAIAAGLDPRFEILDARAAAAELRHAAEAALDELFANEPEPFRALMSAWKTDDPAASLIGCYSEIRVGGSGLDLLDARPADADGWTALVEAVRRMRTDSPLATTDAQQVRLDKLDAWLCAAAALPPDVPGVAHLECLDSFSCDKRGLKAGHPIHDTLDAVRNELLPAARRAILASMYAAGRETLARLVRRFDAIYRQRKRQLASLDFNDLEERAIALLKDTPPLREAVQHSFDAILMDELQDTNPLQWELMRLIRRPDRFFAVGDINQSIFGFRHAEPDVFRGYQDSVERSGAVLDRLTRNHRSRPEILAAVGAIVGARPGMERPELHSGRGFPSKQEPSIEVIAASGEDSAEGTELEALWIARRIRELQGVLPVGEGERRRPARFGDIAVLVRNTSVVGEIEDAFRRFDVPFLMHRGRKFFDEPEIADLTAWLRVLANPLDEISLATVLRSPLVGASDETLLRLKLLQGPRDVNLWEAIVQFDARDLSAWDGGDVERLRWLRRLVRELRAVRDEVAPDRLLARVIDESGYEDSLDLRTRANIAKFLTLSREWYAARSRPLGEWLDTLEDLRDIADEPNAPANETPDAVQVMSIHASKGLEFPVIFVAAMHKGVPGKPPSICFSPDAGLGVLWRDPATGKGCGDPAHEAIVRRRKQREELESDRLLYVAMTRAEEHLVLSFARTKQARSPWPALVESGAGDGVRCLNVNEPPEPMARVERPEVSAPEPIELPAPVLDGQFDSTASVTAVARFAACPRQYFLSRYLGWSQEARSRWAAEPGEEPAEEWRLGELDPTEFGRAVHDVLAFGPTPETPPEAIELAARFTESELGIRAGRAERVEREWDLLFAVEEVILRGQIDLWFEEGGELVLVDYKTDRFDPDEEPERAGSYAVQLRLYALALAGVAGRMPDRAVLYFLRSNRELDVALGREEIEAARALVRGLREAQERLEFPLNEGQHCRRCAFYQAQCPAAGEKSATPGTSRPPSSSAAPA